ncbi:MAG: ABC transporter permease [Acidimicrobiia bacterium]|nr:ABC transporter permease [Acidimicrobiia bacterium]
MGPAALAGPGAGGVGLGAFFLLPLVGFLQRAPWSDILDRLGSPEVRTALRLSAVCSVSAAALAVVLGVPIAWLLARADFPGRSIVRALVLLPLVLPPVVGGVALLLAFGRRGFVGQYLDSWLGIQLPFSTAGVVVAEAFVAMPLLVITVEGALRSLDPRFEDAAATLGGRRWLVFRRVTLPMIAPSLGAGAVLAWARALGEFGATITFAGNFPGRTQTMPLAVFLALETDREEAIVLGLVLLVVSAAVLAAVGSRVFASRAGVPGRDAERPPAGVGGVTGATPAEGSETGLRADLRVALGAFDLQVELRVAPGELVVVVGPNGSGKSTLLRCLAGLLPIDDGAIVLDGRALDDPRAGVLVPPDRREVGVVFQDGLLFPHLDAAENVAFGLRARGVPRRRARARAGEWLGRVGLAGLDHRRPGQLSGGQAQRVALARALAPEPRLLLLDEPLAALDATTRVEVRRELRRVLTAAGGPRVLVTHDPLDALALADRIVVLEGGRVVQAGTPADVRSRPRSRYVADLVGVNLVAARREGDELVVRGGGRIRAAELPPGATEVLVVVHPRAVALHAERPSGSPRNVWEATVVELDDEGERVRVGLSGAVPLVAEVTPAAVRELELVPGRRVWASVKATEVDVTSA